MLMLLMPEREAQDYFGVLTLNGAKRLFEVLVAGVHPTVVPGEQKVGYIAPEGVEDTEF